MDVRIPVTRSVMPPMDEYYREIASLWESRWLTNGGEKHEKLDAMLREALEVECVTLFANGHLALENAIAAMRLKGEVITTPFTFASTTQAIVRNGLTPVFCDISPIDFTIDVSKIEDLITERTCAIVPVHVYGNICNVREIKRIADSYNLSVIYDAAHAFGEKVGGVNVAQFGDLSMFSFHATKVFHTVEGGCVVCRDSKIQARLEALKNFGMRNAERVEEIGGNAKMSEFHAAMGLCNLRHIHETVVGRKKVAELYRNLLSNVDGLYICPENPSVESNYAYFPVVVDEKHFGVDRDTLQGRLLEKGVMTRKYFFPATNTLKCYEGHFLLQKTPIADAISRRVLALPLYSELSIEDASFVVDSILEERS